MRDDTLAAIRDIVALLVRGEYSEIEARTAGKRLSGGQIKDAVEEYGRSLQMHPEGKFTLDSIQVVDRIPPTWSVRIDLWTQEEGLSDLSLELTVEELERGVRIEVDNLYVL